MKGKTYIKKSNKLKFIVIDVIDDDVHFREKDYMNTRIMNKKDFLNSFDCEDIQYSADFVKEFGLWLGNNLAKNKGKNIDDLFNDFLGIVGK